jgi:hypothetical protein
MNYQEILIKIRPQIVNKSIENNVSEEFQNETLRPILKLLNSAIIKISKAFIFQMDINYSNKSPYESEKILSDLIKKHPTFKHQLCGMIISYFTEIELDIYIKNQKEINKRIFNLLHERLRSQLKLLID